VDGKYLKDGIDYIGVLDEVGRTFVDVLDIAFPA